MKSIKKFIFVMAALAAVLAFVSCSNGSDDGGSSNNNNSSSNNNASDNSNNNGNDNNSNSNGNTIAKPSVVATYESDDGLVLTFIGDGKGTGTWSVVEYIQGNEINWSNGTFEGFPEKNSAIDIKWKAYWDTDLKMTKDVSELDWRDRYSISDGNLYFDYLGNYIKVLFERQ